MRQENEWTKPNRKIETHAIIATNMTTWNEISKSSTNSSTQIKDNQTHKALNYTQYIRIHSYIHFIYKYIYLYVYVYTIKIKYNTKKHYNGIGKMVKWDSKYMWKFRYYIQMDPSHVQNVHQAKSFFAFLAAFIHNK